MVDSDATGRQILDGLKQGRTGGNFLLVSEPIVQPDETKERTPAVVVAICSGDPKCGSERKRTKILASNELARRKQRPWTNFGKWCRRQFLVALQM